MPGVMWLLGGSFLLLSSSARVAFLTCLYNLGFKGDRCFEVTINSWRTALSLFAVGFLV
jgi:hypothetical protein